MGHHGLQRTVGALQIIGGIAELYYGGGSGMGGGGGYLIGSGIENVQGKKSGSYNQPGGFGADLMGSLGIGGMNPHHSKAGMIGGAAGGLLGGLGGGGSGGFGGGFGGAQPGASLGSGNFSMMGGLTGALGGNYGGGMLLGGSGGGGLSNLLGGLGGSGGGLGGLFGGGGQGGAAPAGQPMGGYGNLVEQNPPDLLGGGPASGSLVPMSQPAGGSGGGGVTDFLKSPQGINLISTLVGGMKDQQAGGVPPNFQSQSLNALNPQDMQGVQLPGFGAVQGGPQQGNYQPTQIQNLQTAQPQPPAAPGGNSQATAKLVQLLLGGGGAATPYG